MSNDVKRNISSVMPIMRGTSRVKKIIRNLTTIWEDKIKLYSYGSYPSGLITSRTTYVENSGVCQITESSSGINIHHTDLRYGLFFIRFTPLVDFTNFTKLKLLYSASGTYHASGDHTKFGFNPNATGIAGTPTTIPYGIQIYDGTNITVEIDISSYNSSYYVYIGTLASAGDILIKEIWLE